MSFEIRSVLVALDGSSRAPGVLRTALGIAQRFGARLYPFRALIIPPEFPPAAALRHGDELPHLMRRKAIEELDQLLAAAPPYAVEPFLIEQGAQPWRAILAAADQLDADLIVLGSHGLGGLDHVLGTTAAKVANNSTRNVLIVHDRT